MRRETLALLGACLLLQQCCTVAASLKAICAASSTNQRLPTGPSSYVSCVNRAVWDVRSCPSTPKGLVFDYRRQACVPGPGGAPLIPPPSAPPPTPAAPPSLFLYVWAGADNPSQQCRDALVVLDGTPESASFGRVLNVSYAPSWGTEPHHVGLVPGSPSRPPVLAVGSLQAYLRGAPDIHFFDLTAPTAPKWIASADPPLSSVTDSFVAAKPEMEGGLYGPAGEGGFWVSQMGSADGGTPGRIVRLGGHPNFGVLAELPLKPPPGFNPHGYAIDTARAAALGTAPRIVTADYLELRSTLDGPTVPRRFRGSGTPVYRNTLRTWQMPRPGRPDLKPVGVYSSPERKKSLGFMSVQFVRDTGIAVSENGRGIVWAVDAYGAPNRAQPAHFGGSSTVSVVFAPLPFSNSTRFIATVLGQSMVQLLDTTNASRWRVVQEVYLPTGTYPHAIAMARDGALVSVSAYYVKQAYGTSPGFGVVQQYGTRKVFLFDVTDSSLKLSARRPVVNFKADVAAYLAKKQGTKGTCGGWRPHGMAFRSVPPPSPAA